MATKKPYSGPRKLVLAFDIGTAHSGISYCILQSGQIPDVRGVARFPGQERGNGNYKVPSILYYDARGNARAVGSEALSMSTVENAEKNGWIKAEWKHHLRFKDPVTTHIKDKDVPPLPFGKSAVDVFADFIKYLYSSAREYIDDHHTGFEWTSIENSIEFIFSFPNGWGALEQQKYREAIERAGLVPRTPEGRSRVHMISEGEAKLWFCISSPASEIFTQTGPQSVVIVDAGAGTIDLYIYFATFNPVRCMEIAPAECRLQGAVFVARRAAVMLKEKLEGSGHDNPEEMDGLIRRFEQMTMPTIRSPDQPAYLTVGGPDIRNLQFNIRRGTLKLSGGEATSLFNGSISAIIDAFDKQSKAANTKVAMVFLLGVLGTNDFVWSRLQAHFRARDISISRPDNDINNVANGAVLSCLSHLVM